jgi:hypothetical protein
LASTPSSRRDFLKKAGIVGGIAWSVPVLQTVMAPAHAASNTPLGQACTGTGTCANGVAYCNNVTCGGLGATCPGGALCSGSNCSGVGGAQPNVCGGKGAACTSNGECLGGNCNTGSHKCQ